MPHTILLKPEVAKRLRTSVASVDRNLALRRKGIGHFPLPLSQFKGKGRWLESDIDDYIESLSNVNVTAPVPTQSEKKKAKDFDELQERAKVALARHRK